MRRQRYNKPLLSKILATIHIYPSWWEVDKLVAGDWRKVHAPERLLAGAEKYLRWARSRQKAFTISRYQNEMSCLL